MDFELSEDQRALKDSIERFLSDKYDLEGRRKASASERGYSEDIWREFAEMGWLALPISEDGGGLGFGPAEIMILMEALGKHLVVEPYLASVVLAGCLIDRLGSAGQKDANLPGLIAGERMLAFAHSEPDAGYDLTHVETRAGKTANGYVLSGRKTIVLAGDVADAIIVSARTGGETQDSEGVTLFVVPTGAEGLDVVGFATVDGARAAEITLDGVAVGADDVLGEVGAAGAEIERAADIAIAAQGAEAMGAMEALYGQTRDFLATRKQFGAPLISFQVLQHRLVDMFTLYQETISLVYAATLMLDEDGAAAKRTVSAMKSHIGKAGRRVAQEAVQMHGGMGMTDELAVGHYFKRLMAIDALFGNADYHRKRFAALG